MTFLEDSSTSRQPLGLNTGASCAICNITVKRFCNGPLRATSTYDGSLSSVSCPLLDSLSASSSELFLGILSHGSSDQYELDSWSSSTSSDSSLRMSASAVRSISAVVSRSWVDSPTKPSSAGIVLDKMLTLLVRRFSLFRLSWLKVLSLRIEEIRPTLSDFPNSSSAVLRLLLLLRLLRLDPEDSAPSPIANASAAYDFSDEYRLYGVVGVCTDP
mmetsp:Transcript_24180/g.38624  ORF Transcript_24180/g.38624 Transcript_24180/m.38624 type:complete len:216 (+) Transcript_24180:1030-1677(+)